MVTEQENIEQASAFYRNYYGAFLVLIGVLTVIVLILTAIVFYQVKTRPLPVFIAVAPNNAQMTLVPLDEPNFLPNTILQWATKAAVLSYTYSFSKIAYESQLAQVRPYYTQDGWDNYYNSIVSVLNTLQQNQVAVNAVVDNTPVIASQGDFGNGYQWKVQLPFLVTTASSEIAVQKHFTVMLTLVKVPTIINPTGIGIDQFVMLGS